jgi:hypothetical protein
LPPFNFVIPKQITDNCFRFHQYIIHLCMCYIGYFAQIYTLVEITIFTYVKQSQILLFYTFNASKLTNTFSK